MRLLRSGKAQPDVVALRLDPVACDGVGMCAHIAPNLIGLDPWGFPLVASEPLGERDRGAARRAVAGCPRRALFLDIQARDGQARVGQARDVQAGSQTT